MNTQLELTDDAGFYFEYIPSMQTSQADSKDKKVDQPPQAKKAKVKTTTVDLPIENQLVWQIGKDMLNLFIENEVNLYLPKLKMLLVDLGSSAVCEAW